MCEQWQDKKQLGLAGDKLLHSETVATNQE
jgi:hypothetical protein